MSAAPCLKDWDFTTRETYPPSYPMPDKLVCPDDTLTFYNALLAANALSMASNSSLPSSSGMCPTFFMLEDAPLSSEFVFLLLLPPLLIDSCCYSPVFAALLFAMGDCWLQFMGLIWYKLMSTVYMSLSSPLSLETRLMIALSSMSIFAIRLRCCTFLRSI